MTVASRDPVPHPARELAWHAPVHLGMAITMIAVMLPGAGSGTHLTGAGLLVLLALGVAPFARSRPALAPVLLDVAVTAVVLVLAALGGPVRHAHGAGAGLAVLPVMTVAGVAWLLARVRVTRGAVATTSGVLSGAGLAVMALLA